LLLLLGEHIADLLLGFRSGLEAEVRSACEDAESSDVASALKVCAEEIDADQE
jgi:hypothetical protein